MLRRAVQQKYVHNNALYPACLWHSADALPHTALHSTAAIDGTVHSLACVCACACTHPCTSWACAPWAGAPWGTWGSGRKCVAGRCGRSCTLQQQQGTGQKRGVSNLRYLLCTQCMCSWLCAAHHHAWDAPCLITCVKYTLCTLVCMSQAVLITQPLLMNGAMDHAYSCPWWSAACGRGCCPHRPCGAQPQGGCRSTVGRQQHQGQWQQQGWLDMFGL